ncbi:cysteine-rich RECEPTOR-like kinase [Rhynchospora pubera]|uniref:non-specific serine/threonine protein kinase n=1 Tax=Rhynchospora pubera TaxID=906938 RepID=A0AAV8GEP4_9POAL|nr:cysteine-rich RECEPTOR-like kinase [Rhynchospora pubera]
MQYIPLYFLLLFLTSFLSLHATLGFNIPLHYICGSTGNYTASSAYGSNLQKLFSSLFTEVVATEGFSKNTTGTEPDQVSGIILCRNNINSSVCGNCLNQSMVDIKNLCPYSKEATFWYENCLLHYSNQNFLNSTNNSPLVYLWNTKNSTRGRITGWESSNIALKSYINTFMNILFYSVSDRAAYTSEKRFGTDETNITASLPVISGSAQCTHDMSNISCHECLQDLIHQMLQLFDGRKDGMILGVRCSLRYEVVHTFSGYVNLQGSSVTRVLSDLPSSDNQPTASPVTSPPSDTSQGGINKPIIIIVCTIVALLLFGLCFSFVWIRRHRNPETELSQEEIICTTADEAPNIWIRRLSSDLPLFDFNHIAKATDNFSLYNKLGEGGFGPVYKGVLQDGFEIAVKRLSSQSGQGLVEFRNEIQLIAKLQHKNLVRLVGWCIKGGERLVIYEFMPNKSLDCFIFEEREALLNWERRFVIIEGIAQGIVYLHQHSRLRIIHRDLKASNILLDSEMNPKISDFGMARIFEPKELQANTGRIVGTYGYMAPEYASEGLFSIKSDVFSYGVLVLEIISSKKSMGFHRYGDFLNLLGYAWDRWNDGKYSELISPTLIEAPQVQIERCIHVALLCVQENPADRPTMSDVIVFLSTESIILPKPKQPAYFNVRVSKKMVESSDFDGSTSSVNDMTLTNPGVR